MRTVDATTDFGTQPQGLTRTDGRCNYQSAITGPLGAVIFYCTNAKKCDGEPHRVSLGDDAHRIQVSWSSAEDIEQRKLGNYAP